MSSRHRILEPAGRWHATIQIIDIYLWFFIPYRPHIIAKCLMASVRLFDCVFIRSGTGHYQSKETYADNLSDVVDHFKVKCLLILYIFLQF